MADAKDEDPRVAEALHAMEERIRDARARSLDDGIAMRTPRFVILRKADELHPLELCALDEDVTKLEDDLARVTEELDECEDDGARAGKHLSEVTRSLIDSDADLARVTEERDEARKKVAGWQRERQYTNGKEVARAVAIEHQSREDVHQQVRITLIQVTSERDEAVAHARDLIKQDERGMCELGDRRRENTRLREFAERIVRITCWGADPDNLGGDDVQSLAIKHGIIRSVPGGFDPDKHHDHSGCCEPGDTFYEFVRGEGASGE